ncbi:hypothetical protein BN2475_420111 [Paraburkholderia ribeironis]|uniref:Uncharacterized protein n=1 Tax=Paraburkholderia ribeironis TaxID=1247936 RepID=A0A1N7S7Y7_9BURK|nr:hypothetical protein BN2475_420111 [Paraburkholderia ribeironis]
MAQNGHKLAGERTIRAYPPQHRLTRLCTRLRLGANLYSSGGASAGIHLALSLVREDLGEHAAGKIATALLTPPARSATPARGLDDRHESDSQGSREPAPA